MRKIIIIGCPGSGKSRLSKRLYEKTGIPLYHLDNIWWKNDNEHITRDAFDMELEKIFVTDAWIIDGDYSRTYRVRFNACDTVVFLDYDKETCLNGIIERQNDGRDDCPINGVTDVLINEVNAYGTNNRPVIEELLEEYSNKEIHVFKRREDADAWVDNI